MRYGFYLPTRGQTATPEALETLARGGETLGFHSVMITEAAGSERHPFTGTADQIAADIATYAGLGVSELIFDFRRENLSESVERMEVSASDVRALVTER